ncbi:ABC transporter ATP-binding protein [Cohnella hashimotonis]|uniref:ATP-binding cassette domain-containing protein n=1 Tax=Cohnella hashimotonis TaxID=2826895 RepID=A0ABT6TTE8_9BACL|nr:ATP-binding cassette domain-containing protein [Cohnella hashimotonis]MDI4649994.1 ATP-binding cassette domain-containing protein [Cohnella hashimotonis]
MEIVAAQRLTFRYPDAAQPALTEVDLSIRKGEFVVLCGASGSGKTTLLRHFKRELAPVGDLSGSVRYDGWPLAALPDGRAAEEIGFVFQHPESQIVMDTVWHELAFSMENRGFPQVVMRQRLAELSSFFGLEPLMQRSVHELSGGQTQLVNLASVLLLQPRLLLLDEPTSQLDPVAAREFVHLLRRLNEEFGVTVIASEHRLDDILPLADRLVVMADGRIRHDGSPGEVCRRIWATDDPRERLYVPSVARLLAALDDAGTGAADRTAAAPDTPLPLTVREAVAALDRLAEERAASDGPADHAPMAGGPHGQASADGAETRRPPASSGVSQLRSLLRLSARQGAQGFAEALSCRELTYRFERDLPDVLRKLSLQVREGELLAILGGNGAGKSTLLQLMAGLRKPQRGKIAIAPGRKLGYLAQNPMLYFSSDTVREEFEREAEHAGYRGGAAAAEIAHWTEAFDLGALSDRHPHDLSGGQQQKLALALALLPRPDILCIDEPTKGLDPDAKEAFAALLLQLREEGMTIVMVTHDAEFAARHADRCALLYDGEIAAAAEPPLFFGGNYFYTTAVNRAVRHRYPDAVTAEEVMRRWTSEAARS